MYMHCTSCGSVWRPPNVGDTKLYKPSLCFSDHPDMHALLRPICCLCCHCKHVSRLCGVYCGVLCCAEPLTLPPVWHDQVHYSNLHAHRKQSSWKQPGRSWLGSRRRGRRQKGLPGWRHSARQRSRQLSSKPRLKPKLSLSRSGQSARLGYACLCQPPLL